MHIVLISDVHTYFIFIISRDPAMKARKQKKRIDGKEYPTMKHNGDF